ncbi:MAG: hypothetical protein PHQ91_12140 [Thermoanaerobaculaceae bacterium]|nr:hypothetical protein [Thermoanaerobaculaceae bacterium]TAM48716.1 MAG: hypothetical protein EPN53_09330 [Acidobacteriota bacterium]
MKSWGLAFGALLTSASALAVMPATDQFVPALAHINGFGDARWRGDVWIYNPAADRPATVDIDLLLRQANPNPVSQRITVQPGETRYLEDIIGAGLFQLTNAAGGIRVVSSSPVVVTARSYNANVTTAKGTATSGQFFGGVPAALAVGAGDATDVIGLDQDAAADTGAWRSNLALVETTGNTVDFVLDRVGPDGTVVGSLACDGSNPSCAPLGPWEVRQFDLVLTKFSPPTGANQRIRIRVTGGSGRLIAAGSRIDNVTGDPSTVEMAGGGRTGAYLCALARTDYQTPLTLTVDQGAVTALDATILFTDADVPACSNFQVLRLAGPLATPVAYDDAGNFNFVVSNTGLGVTLQVNGTITVAGTVSGNATVTVTGVPGCSGSKSWALTGARLP